MATWENELFNAVAANNLTEAKSILARDAVRTSGTLGRQEWGAGVHSLQNAAYSGRVEMVQAMIDAGFDVDSYTTVSNYYFAPGDRFTSLHGAISANQLATVKLLLELGADTELDGVGGQYRGTPIDWAKQMGKTEIIRLLTEHPESLSSFQTLDSMAKLMQKSKKEADLAEGRKLRVEIEAMEDQVKQTREEIQETENKLASKKERLATLTTDLRKRKSNHVFRFMDMLEKQLEEIETITVTLRGILVQDDAHPRDAADCCPICFVFPKEVFSCEECDNWICQECRSQAVTCPTCRVDLTAKPLRRSKALERHLEAHKLPKP